MRTLDRVEVQATLARCAGTLDDGARDCDRVTKYVGWAMSPAHGGTRTNVTLFGVCGLHSYHRQGIEAELASQGFYGANLVPYEKVGEVFAMLEEARLVKVA